MITDKRNVLQLVALLKAHGIKKIIICGGSRNIPLIQTFLNTQGFVCQAVADEKSAGFFAIGHSLHDGIAAAVVCTTGSSLTALFPAVAEAFHQQVPLIVISADKPVSWIGQMDGQSVCQNGIFGKTVKLSVCLPEIKSDDDAWLCNRLVNQAILETYHHGKGPVHINVPLSEPLFGVVDEELPEERVINRYHGLNVYEQDFSPLTEKLNKYKRRMVVTGQMNMIYEFDKKYSKLLGNQFVWLTENLSNRTIPGEPIRRIDEILYPMDKETQDKMCPELLITFGGHITSRRLKFFLRNHKPIEHWHVSPDGEIVDLYHGSLTTVIEMNPFEFLETISTLVNDVPPSYPRQWKSLYDNLPQPQFPYSEMSVIGKAIERLTGDCSLHLGNGSPVRYAQMFNLRESVEVLSNQGLDGADGSLSTALGYSSASEKINYLIIGDMAFFHDMNALWSTNYGSNIRILLINNGGNGQLQSLPGYDMDTNTRKFVAGTHNTSAEVWAKECGFRYIAVHNEDELENAIIDFTNPSLSKQPVLMETFTDAASDNEAMKSYLRSLKNK